MKLAIIDFNRTIYDPDSQNLIDGAMEFLSLLAAQDVRMVLYSQKKDREGREEALERLGVHTFFSETAFVDKKNAETIQAIMRRHGAEPGNTFVVGDYMFEEIRAGNQAGAFTIQYRQGAYAHFTPEIPDDVPKAIVERLVDAIKYIVESN